MTQLSYQAAFDPYHAVFRALRLRGTCWAESAVHFDKLRILDFYLTFPFFLKDMRLKRTDSWIRRVSKQYDGQKPFAKLPDGTTLVRRMEPYQLAAVQALTRHGYARKDQWDQRYVQASSQTLPEELSARVKGLNNENQDLMSALRELSANYELLGPDGLKDRSELLEYRYDAV
ncbi:ABC-three component system middle component 5 [Roseivivax marinus]|uniref:ABC-three component system middle component 5 n=1 Tax=Roseivivax marinus TaxID=1379903 RepID=UPI0011134273|nr:ABC-three component system middle component 5 [Roseivivax marinus]